MSVALRARYCSLKSNTPSLISFCFSRSKKHILAFKNLWGSKTSTEDFILYKFCKIPFQSLQYCWDEGFSNGRRENGSYQIRIVLIKSWILIQIKNWFRTEKTRWLIEMSVSRKYIWFVLISWLLTFFKAIMLTNMWFHTVNWKIVNCFLKYWNKQLKIALLPGNF